MGSIGSHPAEKERGEATRKNSALAVRYDANEEQQVQAEWT